MSTTPGYTPSTDAGTGATAHTADVGLMVHPVPPVPLGAGKDVSFWNGLSERF